MHIQRQQTTVTTSRTQVSTPLPHFPKKKEIDFKALYQDLQTKGFKPVQNRYGEQEPNKIDLDAAPKKIYVEWGSAVVGTGPVLLGTRGIDTCAALSIIDPTNENIHYLLHAYTRTFPHSIQASLERAKALGINLKDSEIEIMPGRRFNLSSTPHILEGLYLVDSNLLDKVVLISDVARSKRGYTQAIIVCEGKTFGLEIPTEIPFDQKLGNPYDQFRFELKKDGVEVVLYYA